MSVNAPSRLSYSAVSSYAECGERFRLERLHRIPRSTWYSTIGGKAIHDITEFIDRCEFDGFSLEDGAAMAPTFKAVFDRLLADPKEVTEAGIQASQKKGMKTITENGGPNGKDYDWWLHWGPLYVARYVRWRLAQGWRVAELGGSPGIELEFNMEIAGIRVQGFIDRLMLDPHAEAFVLLDIKSGKEPSGKLQLASYGMALDHKYGLVVPFGAYWLPSSPSFYKGTEEENIGHLSEIVSLRTFDNERVAYMYESAKRGIEAGVFIPQVTNMCKGCGVREFCWAVGGKKVKEIPVSDTIVDGVTGAVVFERPSV